MNLKRTHVSGVPTETHTKAGKIAARVLTEACETVKPGMKIAALCSLVEKRIIELGGRPAFPCNVSVQQVAAHYTSTIGDSSTIPSFGLVKIDIGVHIDGYIADTARTVDMDGSLEGFIAATDDALTEAIKLMQPGETLGTIGKTIERVINSYGIRPVKELAGHSLERYRLHAGKDVPNFATRNSTKIEIGDCFAIEPFATSGSGISESKNVYIFANTNMERTLAGITEKLRIHLREKYGTLPFAMRWVRAVRKDIDIVEEFRKLLAAKVIRGYPVLIEKNNRPVSQSEHTVFISDRGPIVLTQTA